MDEKCWRCLRVLDDLDDLVPGFEAEDEFPAPFEDLWRCKDRAACARRAA